MKRFFVIAAVAAMGLSLLSVSSTRAGGQSGRSEGRPSGGSGSFSGHHDEGHRFRANERFNYRRHGYESLSWTQYHWSNSYRCYCYYSPSYGWCFYEPTYSYYVPVSHFSEVYPESVSTSPPIVNSTQQAQQTTVVNVGSTPTVDLPPRPLPPSMERVGPPVNVQKTNVGPNVP